MSPVSVSTRIRHFTKRTYVRHVFLLWVFFTIIVGLFAPLQSKLMGPAASTQMEVVQETMTLFTYMAAPVAGLIFAVVAYSLLAWRSKGFVAPEYEGTSSRGNGPTTVAWMLVSSLLCVVLLIWGLAEMADGQTARGDERARIINVTGNQWVWNFDYIENGSVRSQELYLPVNEPVLFHVTSVDVNHSFWIVQMGVKVDANAGVVTDMRVTPTLIGDFDIRCAELCGLNHSAMFTKVHVVSQGDYLAWILKNGGHQ
ncbi:MAG: cytochrome c oxidase subunit II [Actinomycetes bacterium]